MNRTLGRREAGVTLIELITVVIVVAILASIAVPSYRQYLLRTNRADAKTALLKLQAAQEKFYLSNNAYTDKVSDAPPAGLGLMAKSDHGFYQLKVELKDTGYLATAEVVSGAGQQDDKPCLNFTITDTGVRGVSAAGGNVNTCWK